LKGFIFFFMDGNTILLGGKGKPSHAYRKMLVYDSTKALPNLQMYNKVRTGEDAWH
jgi:hypothetical protein